MLWLTPSWPWPWPWLQTIFTAEATMRSPSGKGTRTIELPIGLSREIKPRNRRKEQIELSYYWSTVAFPTIGVCPLENCKTGRSFKTFDSHLSWCICQWGFCIPTGPTAFRPTSTNLLPFKGLFLQIFTYFWAYPAEPDEVGFWRGIKITRSVYLTDTPYLLFFSRWH
jgi:hypothetical protein